MPTVLGSGNTTLSDGNETTLYESTSNKHFGAEVNLDEMLSGDTTRVKVYTKVLTGDAYAEFFDQTYSGVDGGQGAPVIYFPFKSGPYGYKLTIQQTAGTLRSYKWRVDEP